MRNAEGGTRNRPCGCRALKPAPGIEPDEPVPPSAFRVPRSFLGVALLTVFSLACGGDRRTPLIVYSPHGRDLLTLLERRFEQLHPDVDVRWLDMGSQEVYDRLRSERANPQADVWFGGPATIFALGARDSLLESFRPTWVEALEPHGRGPGDLYFAAYETPAVIVYAEQAVKPDEAPRATAPRAGRSSSTCAASPRSWRQPERRTGCPRDSICRWTRCRPGRARSGA